MCIRTGLSTPFLLLPYRPNTDPCAARSFIRNFFSPSNSQLTGPYLQQELRLTDPDVLCSALKWCWSRLPGGVVTWEVYEMFRQVSRRCRSASGGEGGEGGEGGGFW